MIEPEDQDAFIQCLGDFALEGSTSHGVRAVCYICGEAVSPFYSDQFLDGGCDASKVIRWIVKHRDSCRLAI